MPLVIAGATSGSTTIQATDAVTATITLPSATGTVQLTGGAVSATTITASGGVTITGGAIGYGGGELNLGTNTNSAGIFDTATGSPSIFFDHRGTGNTGDYRWRNGTGGGTSLMTLNTVGGLQTLNTIGVGNATPSTSGAGITFPATQSASTDANTLDDYEEGTWTPTVTVNTGTGTTYSVLGTYTKIGNVVTFSCRVGSTNGSMIGITVASLPFTSSASSVVTGILETNISDGGIVGTGTIVASATTIVSNAVNVVTGKNINFTGSYIV